MYPMVEIAVHLRNFNIIWERNHHCKSKKGELLIHFKDMTESQLNQDNCCGILVGAGEVIPNSKFIANIQICTFICQKLVQQFWLYAKFNKLIVRIQYSTPNLLSRLSLSLVALPLSLPPPPPPPFRQFLEILSFLFLFFWKPSSFFISTVHRVFLPPIPQLVILFPFANIIFSSCAQQGEGEVLMSSVCR